MSMKEHPEVLLVAQVVAKTPGTCGLSIVNRTNRTAVPEPAAGVTALRRRWSAPVKVPWAAGRHDGSFDAGRVAALDVSTRNSFVPAVGPSPQVAPGSTPDGVAAARLRQSPDDLLGRPPSEPGASTEVLPHPLPSDWS